MKFTAGKSCDLFDCSIRLRAATRPRGLFTFARTNRSGQDIVILNCQKGTQRRGEKIMKTFTALTALTLGLAASGMAAEFKGFVEDTACASKPAMKGNAACAQKCIKGGSPAVLVSED